MVGWTRYSESSCIRLECFSKDTTNVCISRDSRLDILIRTDRYGAVSPVSNGPRRKILEDYLQEVFPRTYYANKLDRRRIAHILLIRDRKSALSLTKVNATLGCSSDGATYRRLPTILPTLLRLRTGSNQTGPLPSSTKKQTGHLH